MGWRILMMHTLTFVAVLMAAGCLRSTEYQCSGNVACSGGGTCESSGYCSFPDGACASGRRYSDAAGTLGSTCVDGENQTIDASIDIDGPSTDAVLPDAQVGSACPGTYAAIAGGQSGHLYRVVTTQSDWGVQEAACRATSPKAHLAIPDDLAELQALDTAIGAAAIYWVGVSDLETEMQWKTVLGAAQTFLPWLAPAPDNQNPGEHCVAALAATHQFNDDRCNTDHPAICECVP